MMDTEKMIERINDQDKRIHALTQQVTALQYMLAQTMTLALRLHPDSQHLLTEMQVFFAEKAARGGVLAGSGDKGFELAEGIFQAVKRSL